MADFVAVIRRAVDGLANNTPEMRAKVYDKARGAVQRQLENMKPRPPEDMLRRQMEKLETAILDVESEHAEALEPLADDAVAAPLLAGEALAGTRPDEPGTQHHEAAAWEEPPATEPAPPPANAGAVFEPARSEPPVSHEERPVFREDDYEEPAPVAAHPVFEPEPAVSHIESPAESAPPEQIAAAPVFEEPPAPVAPPAEEPAPQHYGDWRDDLPPEEGMPAPAAHQPEPGPAPVAAAPVFEETAEHFSERQEQRVAEDEPVFEPVETFPAPAAPVWDEPVAAESAPVADPWIEPSPVEPLSAQPSEDDFPYPSRSDQHAAPTAPEFTGWELEPVAAEPPAAVAPVAADGEPGPAAEAPKSIEDWGWDIPEPAPAQQVDVSSAWDDVPELLPAGPVEPVDHGAKPAAVEAHFDSETHVSADSVRMPLVSDLPDLSVPPTAPDAPAAPENTVPSSDDPFADYLGQKPATVTAAKPAENDPWGDLEELIGFNKDTPVSGGSPRALHTDADADDLMSAPARPYRVTPVRKRNYAGILLAIVGLALVGGGGYAIWLNRDSLNDMVDGLFQSNPAGSQTAQQAPPRTSAPAPTNPAPSSPAPANSTAANPPASQPAPATPAPSQQANTNPAAPAASRAADGSIAGNKFTQRLMPDGSEMDDGAGGSGGLAQNAEGQSVAQLNAPPAQPAPAAQAPAANAPAAAGTPPVSSAPSAAAPNVNAPAATPADAPALAGEKMFLYEERIGQTAPTAIEGAVSWSLQREPGANGRQEPVVQGRINIPGRGLTALLTFKRNSDPSLPASHLIEIVFAVPPDFEGGAIDSVQRIAMKSTEQDRGNALIAVPAKITDDFHMIALNDFPDARTTNLELLRTRNWIDIPVAYRNGRRALLTLQKGPEGERAFNEAIREWGTLGATASGQ